jgi:zinc and cadmium transporter
MTGAATLALKFERLKPWLLYLVSFSAGALLGDVFFHALPELLEAGDAVRYGLYIMAGIVLFVLLERLIHWHFPHTEHEESVHSIVYVTMVGDTLHNFIDGLIIAGAFLINIPLGIVTTVAVILHEIPQELGQFAIFLHGGWSVKKALLYNLFSALAAIAGAVLALLFSSQFAEVPALLISFAIASFIYVAMSDIIPELHKEANMKKFFIQLTTFVIGIGFMALLLLLE